MPTKRLRVLAGPTADPANMSDITQLVNSPTPFEIKSEDFEGRIVACIKDFHAGVGEGEGGTEDGEGKDDKNDGSWYFGRADRQGVTWSIQVQGRFLKPHPASNILFGNIFDRPLRLPWGSGAALKFMSFIDPTLTHDLGSQTTPWALSPLVSTMPYLDISPAGQEPAFPHGDKVSGSPSSEPSPVSSPEASRPPSKAPSQALAEDAADALSWTFDNASARKAHFSTPAAREEAVLGPDTVVTCDFAYGFLSFSPSISLVLPGGLSFDLMRYWDGQPVRFVCCERASGGGKRDANGVRQDVGGSEELPWGKVIWSVCIELVEEDD
uniref:Domain of unknown function at the cortex 1 domain-containing protein n=1 Tax=Schizophyllum commune (strain H4-8 / FGSC 9210) TaxID=578458 RepID=D8QKE7_SCHCM